MSAVRGVLFDFGNTLFAHASLAETIAATCAGLGEPRPPLWSQAVADRIDAAAHTADELQYPRDLDVDVWRERWHVLYTVADDEIPGLGAAIYSAMHDPAKWHPYASAASTLGNVHSRDVPIAIVSNTGWDVRTVFAHYQLDHVVTAFVLSYEVGVVKPHQQIFLDACAALDREPGECLMVGDDSRADVGAVAAGLRTLLLPAREPGADNGIGVVAQIVSGE
jgi:FMN phosphatase YigB (HAD superfamily)